MSTDDRDDPGADTAMFRAYVDHPSEPPAAPAGNRALVIAAVVAIVVLAVVALALLA
ncbi:MAG TPA: hypothetical protein VF015_10605 [Acidimicrobiales bacterium]